MRNKMAENLPTDPLFLAGEIEEETISDIQKLFAVLDAKGATAGCIQTYNECTLTLAQIRLTKKIDYLGGIFSNIAGIDAVFMRNENELSMELLLVLDTDDLDIDDKILDGEDVFYKKYPEDKLHIALLNKLNFEYDLYIAKDYRKIA